MTGGSYSDRRAAAHGEPGALRLGAGLGRDCGAAPAVELTGRSWSGAGAIERVEVSVDGGDDLGPGAAASGRGHRQAWTQWRFIWTKPAARRPRADGPSHRRRRPHASRS